MHVDIDAFLVVSSQCGPVVNNMVVQVLKYHPNQATSCSTRQFHRNGDSPRNVLPIAHARLTIAIPKISEKFVDSRKDSVI